MYIRAQTRTSSLLLDMVELRSLLLRVLLVVAMPLEGHSFTHGWDSASKMLAGDFRTHRSARYDISA